MAKWLFGALLALAAIYGGYWFIGASSVERATQAAIENAREAGWTIETSTPPNTRGFPSRFDTTFEDISMTAPSGLRWEAPLLQAFALSYRPNAVIVVWPQRQKIGLGDYEIIVEAHDMRASGTVAPEAELPLQRATWEVETLRLIPAGGIDIRIQHMLVATRQSPLNPLRYDGHLSLEKLTAGNFLLDDARGDVSVEFDTPLDRDILSHPPRIETVTLDRLSIDAGTAEVVLSGELTFDETGTPYGNLRIRSENWRYLLDHAAEAGLIDPARSDRLLNLVSGLGGTRISHSMLDLTFDIGDGYMSLAGFPVLKIASLPYRQ